VNQTTTEWVRLYRSKGLPVLKVDRGTKECHIDNWDKLSPEKLERMITDEDDVGIRLDNLSVLDFERPELVEAMFTEGVDVLSQHSWVAKTGRGYHIYMRGLPLGKKIVKADELVEFRSSADYYVVAPPSLHPSGARYEWVTDIEKVGIAEASPQALERMRHRVEVLRLFGPFIKRLEKAWTESHRHYLALWLSGVLYKLGYGQEDAELVIKAVARLAHDNEVGDRMRALHDTYRKERREVGAWSKLRAELESIVGTEKARELLSLLPRPELDFEIKPLSQLVAEAKPIEWIAEGLVPKYGLVILAGKAGVGKSFLSLHLAHAVANGENLLGIVPIQHRGRVLIIDNENYPGLYLQRVAALGLNPLDGIDVLNLSGFRIDSKGCVEWLEKTLMDQKYSMIILDSWSDLTSRVDENKADEVGRVLSRLRRLSYENECCFVLIHHLRKNLPFAVEAKDELRGSSALVNEADVVLLMQNFKDTKFLKTIKMRYGDEQAFEVRFEKDGGRLAIVGRRVAEPEIEGEVMKAVSAIEEYLMVKGNAATRGELIRELPFSKSTVERAISLAHTLRRIIREGRGLYRLPPRLEQYA
jgi:archaellum biogenesis ATPase FlaH